MSSTDPNFIALAREIFKRTLGFSEDVANRRFRGLFGISPNVCGKLWCLLSNNRLASSQPRHLLWALLFLKSYANETVLSALTGADEKTQRLWIWRFLREISCLKLVSVISNFIRLKLTINRLHGIIVVRDHSITAGQVLMARIFQSTSLRISILVGLVINFGDQDFDTKLHFPLVVVQ